MGILLYHDIGVLFMKYVYSTIYKTTISNSTIKTHCIINTKYFICHTRKGQLTIHQEYSKYSIHQQPRTRIVFPTPWFICCYGGQVCRGPMQLSIMSMASIGPGEYWSDIYTLHIRFTLSHIIMIMTCIILVDDTLYYASMYVEKLIEC